MKKILLAAFVLALMSAMSISSVCYIYTGSPIEPQMEQLTELDRQIKDMDQFISQNSVELLNASERSHYSNKRFPSDFAGTYVDDGKLVVNIASDTDSASTYNFAISNGMKVNNVTYSINYLNSLMDTLANLMMDDPDLGIVVVGRSDMTNSILVKMYDMNETKTAEVHKHVDFSPAVTFENSTDREISEDVTMSPTNSLYILRREGTELFRVSFSFGFAASRNFGGLTYHGIVATGHAQGAAVNSEVYIDVGTSRVPVGTIQAIQNSGSVDACFIDLYQGHSARTLAGSLFLSSPAVVALNDTVTLYGAVNMSSASVRLLVASFSSGGVRFNDMIEAPYASAEGDSGGLLETRGSVAGIHKGTGADGTYFSNITNINNALNTHVLASTN